jgi:hypothetical protein
MYLLDATTELQLADTRARERRAEAARDRAERRRLEAAARAAAYRFGLLCIRLGQALQATPPAQSAPTAA